MLRKIVFIALLCVGSMRAFAFEPMSMPRIDEYVEDFSDVLSSNDLEYLRSVAQDHEKNTTEQAVTILFPNRNGNELADIGLRVFRENGIGQKGKNNGILLLIATEEKKIRIITGYGMESRVPDALATRWIEQDIRPMVNRGEYSGAILNFYTHLASSGTIADTLIRSIDPSQYMNRENMWFFLFLGVFMILSLGPWWITSSILRKMEWKSGKYRVGVKTFHDSVSLKKWKTETEKNGKTPVKQGDPSLFIVPLSMLSLILSGIFYGILGMFIAWIATPFILGFLWHVFFTWRLNTLGPDKIAFYRYISPISYSGSGYSREDGKGDQGGFSSWGSSGGSGGGFSGGGGSSGGGGGGD